MGSDCSALVASGRHMVPSTVAHVTHIFEPIVLRRAERVARGYAAGQGESVRRLAVAARARLVAARELAGARSRVGAFTLLREAASLAASAVIASRATEDATVLDPEAAHARLLALIDAAQVPALPAPLSDVAALLATGDPLATDDLPASDLPRAQALVHWLLGLVESRSVEELRMQRVLRLGALAGALVLVLIVAIALAVSAKNLARRGKASASSARTGFDAAATIDGKPKGEGFESGLESDPWLQVDLGDHFQVESVVVYERDGARKAAMPRSLRISDDGSTWRVVATSPGAAADPWRVSLSRPWARYVKLSLDGHGALSVGELEVYGQ